LNRLDFRFVSALRTQRHTESKEIQNQVPFPSLLDSIEKPQLQISLPLRSRGRAEQTTISDDDLHDQLDELYQQVDSL
jgi:hypothetical protein